MPPWVDTYGGVLPTPPGVSLDPDDACLTLKRSRMKTAWRSSLIAARKVLGMGRRSSGYPDGGDLSSPHHCLMAILIWPMLALVPGSARALDPVTLQLKWTHCFQFAGYYAAKAQGYYRDVGLDVQFKEGLPDIDVVDNVIAGRAQFGVGTSHLLLQRAAGKPVVALAVIFQHSPSVLMTKQGPGAPSIQDLAGKRIMIEPESGEIYAYLKREGMGSGAFMEVKHSFNVEDLIDGRVEAMTAYSSNEPELLERRGVPYRLYTPRSAGIDFYADNLFSSEQEISNHPQRVRDFTAASLRGWAYALAHPDEIIDLILGEYHGTDTRAHYQFEANAIRRLMHPELIEIGYMNPGRWQHMAQVYAELGLLPPGFSLDGFLNSPDMKADLSRVYRIIGAFLGVLALIGGTAAYILRINRRLGRSLKRLKAAHKKLQIFSLVVEQSPTSILVTNADNQIEYVNPYFLKESGYRKEEVLGQNPRLLGSGQVPQATYDRMWEQLERGEAWEGELINRRKNGDIYYEEAHIAPLKNADNHISHYVAVKLDITERKRANEQLAFMAYHDPLTGLPNRSLFFDRVEYARALAQRMGTRFALMFLDLDRFKPVNDRWGHAIGDQLLQAAAQRMTSALRASDTVGRIGGDEFVMLILDAGSDEDVLAVAEKIRCALRAPYSIEGRDIAISATIGIAIYPDHAREITELVGHADMAMYRAKEKGRDRVILFEAGWANGLLSGQVSSSSALEGNTASRLGLSPPSSGPQGHPRGVP